MIALAPAVDPGEVARLRDGLKYEGQRAALCLEELQECETQRDEFYAEINGLRAQLAERDALLREVLQVSGELAGDLWERIAAALSASAEPSSPTWSCQPCQLEQPTDRPCDVCGGQTALIAAKS
ncbi:hypothetical protein [Pseudomonas sp.]|uniref:hypothetical protein n=1 Tax=Pseudomonas sp. TaxID=306 RepID=UPI003C76B246